MIRNIFNTTTLLVLIVISAFVVPNQAISGTIPPIDNRLLVLGDSLTAGLYASSENTTYARLVADATGMQLARRYVSTLDLAVAEWTKVKAWHPALIVLEVGLNDVSKGHYGPEWEGQYQSLVQDMQETGAHVVTATMFWAGITKSHPQFNDYIALNESIRNVAQATGAEVADLWSATLDCVDCVSTQTQISYWGPDYHGDGFHPNDVGHALIAEAIINAVCRCQCDPNVPEPVRYLYYFPSLRG